MHGYTRKMDGIWYTACADGAPCEDCDDDYCDCHICLTTKPPLEPDD